MTLHHVGYIDLPLHATPGRFDPTAVHRRSRRVYVAHTANDAVDVIDGFTQRLYRHRGTLDCVDDASFATRLLCDRV